MSIRLTARKLINLKTDLVDISPEPIGDISGFGVVHKGIFLKKHHHEIKRIPCAIKYIETKCDIQNDFESFYNEIKLQNELKHQALLPLLGYYIPFCNSGKLTLVTPLMENGSLAQILKKEKVGQAPDEWYEVKRIITIIGVAAGLCKMHQNNLVHRDIKPANILLDEDLYPKICDFGLSKVFQEGLEEILQRTNCGTEMYKAPEMLLCDPNDCQYNSKVDVFSYGLVLYEIFTDESFYHRCSKDKKTYMNALVNNYRPDISKDKRFTQFFAELISHCWAQDPNDRPTFEEILEKMIEAYKEGKLVDRKDEEIDAYILDNVEDLGIDVEFLKK